MVLQVDECYNLVPVGFDGFVDDADVTEITMLDDLISSVCAGECCSHLQLCLLIFVWIACALHQHVQLVITHV